MSLIELLVVVALIAILAAISVPAFVSIAQGSGMRRAINGISDVLEGARTEAMATSTWVLVGLADTTQVNAARTPQLTLMVVASRDGTTNTAAANLIALAKPVRIENVRILDSPTQWAGNAALLKNSSFRFTGTIAGSAQTFTNTVIAFSPQGEALITPTALSSWIEIPVREMRGTKEIAEKTASIRVSGVSGQVVVNY